MESRAVCVLRHSHGWWLWWDFDAVEAVKVLSGGVVARSFSR